MKILLITALLLAAAAARADGPPATGQGPHAHTRAAWTMRVPSDSDGFGFALLNTREYAEGDAIPRIPHWEEPNLKGSLGIGFDTKDPKTDNAFNADGNIYGRPEREVSLHWDGREIANRVSPVEFREGSHRVEMSMDAVTGGSNVTVRIDGEPVYLNYFVAGAAPYRFRPAFGIGGGDAFAGVSDVRVSGRGAPPPSPPPARVRAFDAALNDKDHQTLANTVDFPARTDDIGRVTCTLTLGETPNGVDPWDRMAAIYVYDDAGRRVEVLRYMTPYDRGGEWTMDVTDYLPLLSGRRKVVLWCETWGAGWLATVEFHFYEGTLERRPIAVETIYDATVPIGDAAQPFGDAIRPRTVTLPRGAKSAKLRFVVTGHGQGPNTDNGAEFIALDRTASVDGKTFTNLLWKTDNYLNPCRPQGGTWKYDRAGWGPGNVVDPWDLDITPQIADGTATIGYTIGPYVNKTPDKGNPARQWITGQVIYYR
jgi:hypothetical protein